MGESRHTELEFTGKSVEEAVERALQELHAERDAIEVEILDEPQKGFLGLGGREARIMVRLKGEGEPVQAPGDVRISSYEDEEVLEVVREILRLMEIDAHAEAKAKEESLVVDIWGEDVGILIGRNGTNLEALQLLVNLVARKKMRKALKIVVDVEGYRKRRRARIEKQAQEKAKEAIERGKSEMPAMSSAERKIVHMVLRDFKGVRTESVGEEPDRRVVIYSERNRSEEDSRETV